MLAELRCLNSGILIASAVARDIVELVNFFRNSRVIAHDRHHATWVSDDRVSESRGSDACDEDETADNSQRPSYKYCQYPAPFNHAW